MKLELGAGKVYAGCLTELEGKKSAFDAKIGYYTSVNQKLDMNYTVRHRGKKTESMMEVSGVLPGRFLQAVPRNDRFRAGMRRGKGN